MPSNPSAPQNYANSRAWTERAHRAIPGGAHTYSKGDDQFPEQAPGFISRGSGCHVWDVDGNEFIDWGMGLRSVILGHGDPGVLDAIRSTLTWSSNFTRPTTLETEAAELLIGQIPCAEMVKFAKNGSDVTSAAIRLARAYTGRDHIARCAEQPFFSVHDWFIGDTVMSSGVPDATRALTHRFNYNDAASLERLFALYPGQIAAVIMEAASTDAPDPGFLENVQAMCAREGTLLIFDEIITGLRWHERGAQAFFNVIPDLSTWSKGLANGFSISALCGRRDVMELGGIRHNKKRTFLLSNTFGGEAHHLSALIETVRRVQGGHVVPRLWRVGQMLIDGFRSAAADAGLTEHAAIHGYACSPWQVFRNERGDVDLSLRTLFLQEMCKRGILIPYIAPSAAHTDQDITRTVEAAAESFLVLRTAVERGSSDGLLVGPATRPVFRPFN